ncbi:LysR family transcriptional regulator [Pseudoduganella violacea]|uniref:DNA-binding transcriptional LysR family regulator n=1 Tax=Pseudoduganella violacea TaxID=1715466 RepID=A0A7W5BAY1_9BURK|nr:LysR family transcriptional regulator [Pseudoduganella violacea]MBB3119643.1 DNA-binding transcriptional LysR family regulator [Pseudoduganella violacea]
MGRRFDHLGDVETFIAVVERGSLTAAAVALATTPSVISRAIARLEARLGAQLLRRTTRSLGLTDAGRLYLEQTRAALAQIDEVERSIQGEGGEVTGTVRISAPTTYGHYRLPAVLARFRQQYPAVRIELNITNRNVDLAAEGFDFAIRQGALKDSGMVARKLEDAAVCLVASPAYLARHGAPASVAELERHACLSFLLPSTGRAIAWQLREEGRDVDWTPESPLQVSDDVLGVLSLAEAGLGICQAYDFIVTERLQRGALVEVLPASRGRSRPFSLIHAGQRRLSAAGRAFASLLQNAQP